METKQNKLFVVFAETFMIAKRSVEQYLYEHKKKFTFSPVYDLFTLENGDIIRIVETKIILLNIRPCIAFIINKSLLTNDEIERIEYHSEKVIYM